MRLRYSFPALILFSAGFLATDARAQSSCTPTDLNSNLNVTINGLSNGFNPAVSTGVPLDVTVLDEQCKAVDNATVTASFSDNTPPITLTRSGSGGKYTGNWTTGSAVANSVVLTVAASAPATVQTPFGSTQITKTGSTLLTGSVAADPTQPLVFSNGLVTAAPSTDGNTAAPGSYLSIYGRNLADGTVSYSTNTFPTTLGGVEVKFDGRNMPIQFVSANQINVVVPSDATTSANHTITVTRNGKTSAQTSLRVISVQPGIFPCGSVGCIVNAANGALVDAAHPVKSGDIILIFASGLGATNPPVNAGEPASTSVLSPTVLPVTVRISGYNAPVLFSGLAPGFVALYQINAVVPAGVPNNDKAEVVLGVVTGGIADQVSPASTMAIRQ